MKTETNHTRNLVRVSPINFERDKNMRLLCVECNNWHPVPDVWADLNGAPFRAYYCNPCATNQTKKG